MTKEEWDKSDRLLDMILCVESERKLNLFICACFRKCWNNIKDEIKEIIIKVELGASIIILIPEFAKLYNFPTFYDGKITGLKTMAIYIGGYLATIYCDSVNAVHDKNWLDIYFSQRDWQLKLLRHMVSYEQLEKP